MFLRGLSSKLTTKQIRVGQRVGLWSVKNFMNSMNGHIVVQRVENEGIGGIALSALIFRGLGQLRSS